MPMTWNIAWLRINHGANILYRAGVNVKRMPTALIVQYLVTRRFIRSTYLEQLQIARFD
jgi:hypothetical protein